MHIEVCVFNVKKLLICVKLWDIKVRKNPINYIKAQETSV